MWRKQSRQKVHFLAALVVLLAFTQQGECASPVTSGLVLHLDASAIDAGNLSQVTTLGKMVQWNDLSANANHASQLVASWRPTYIADGGAPFNHQPVVRFSGSFLDASANATFSNLGHAFAGLNTMPQATVITVMQTNTPGTNQVAVLGQTSLTTRGFPRVQVLGNQWYTGSFNEIFASTPGAGTAPLIYASTFDGTALIPADRLDLDINGVDQSLTAASPANNTGNIVRMLIGIDLTGSFAWNGDIAEVLIFNRVLSDVELNDVGFYLENKYGLDTAYVPEPTSIALAGVGFFAAMFYAYAKRRRK